MSEIFEYELTKEQLTDFNVKYRRKTSKPLLVMTVIMFALSAFFFGMTFAKELVNTYIAVFGFAMFLVTGMFAALILTGMRRGGKTQSETYFKECAVNGIISFRVELLDSEYAVEQPARGNAHHYLYENIVKIAEVDGYFGVVTSNNTCLPVLRNESTERLIAFLKSRITDKTPLRRKL